MVTSKLLCTCLCEVATYCTLGIDVKEILILELECAIVYKNEND